MKNLFKINEEERSRILNLHEGMTKRQYLMETPLTDFYDKLPDETKKKFTAMNSTWEGPGTREGDMLNVLKTFTLNDLNLYNQYLNLHKNSSNPLEYSSFQEIINGEMGKDNLQDVINITNQLKNMGVNATYVKDNIADLHPNSFKITKGGAPSSVAQPMDKNTKKSVVQPLDKNTKKSVVNTKEVYKQRAQQVYKQTQDTNKQIQQALGQEVTGNLDSVNLDYMIGLLKQPTQ
jgi:hypothetical protein